MERKYPLGALGTKYVIILSNHFEIYFWREFKFLYFFLTFWKEKQIPGPQSLTYRQQKILMSQLDERIVSRADSAQQKK